MGGFCGKGPRVSRSPGDARTSRAFRPVKSLLLAAWLGGGTYVGVVYRTVALDGETLHRAARELWPVGPVMFVFTFALVRAIPTFNRHFPRRTE
jgi:uncharacterized membrane protein YdjX (TVP38/TMEM64 family)